MKLLLVCNNLGLGGAERVHVNLANGFAERGEEVYLAADLTQVAKGQAYPVNEKVKILSLCPKETNKYIKWGKGLLRLRIYIREYRPDVVIGNNCFSSLLSRLAACGTGIPVILTIHNALESKTFHFSKSSLMMNHYLPRIFYTIHADPDDWVDPGMLSALYRKAEEENTDMVICDYWLNTYQGQKRVTQRPSSLDHFMVIRDLFGPLMGSTWNKLVRRACYERYGVRFPEDISYCEDLYVSVALLRNPLRVAYLPEAFYHYERPLNTHSLSRNYTDKSYRQDLRLNALFHDLLKDTPVGSFVDEKRQYDTLANAFFNGYGYFSASVFRHTFSSSLPLVWRSCHPLPERILLSLSCLGAYPVARGFVELAMKVKHMIARSSKSSN